MLLVWLSSRTASQRGCLAELRRLSRIGNQSTVGKDTRPHAWPLRDGESRDAGPGIFGVLHS